MFPLREALSALAALQWKTTTLFTPDSSNFALIAALQYKKREVIKPIQSSDTSYTFRK
jgi:hypothetical protein